MVGTRFYLNWAKDNSATASAIFAALLLLGALGCAPQARAGLQAFYEEVSLALFPSAERAYGYGIKHFDAPAHTASYDIVRAQRLFRRALVLEPGYPFVHHQLGRIAFLRGDFQTALWHLDKEIENSAEASASTRYMRGLVLGFMDRPEEAIPEFERFLETQPATWAALNDYAWVLLKAGHLEEASAAAQKGLEHMPDSPWLLNTAAIALFERNDVEQAFILARAAVEAASVLNEKQWLGAYPGNDPLVAQDGILALQQSVLENLRAIERARAE